MYVVAQGNVRYVTADMQFVSLYWFIPVYKSPKFLNSSLFALRLLSHA